MKLHVEIRSQQSEVRAEKYLREKVLRRQFLWRELNYREQFTALMV